MNVALEVELCQRPYRQFGFGEMPGNQDHARVTGKQDVIPGREVRLTGNLGPGHKAPPLCVFLGRGLAR